MVASIPAPAGDENGDEAAISGQAALTQALAAALAGESGQAALLIVDGVPAEAAALAATRLVRRADAMAVASPSRLIVMAPHLREVGGAADLAARILVAMPQEVAATAAIGIAVAPDDGDAVDALVLAAERALARARTYVRGRFAFPDAARDDRWRIGPLLAGAIAEALAGDEFSLVFQPIARLADSQPVGAEALLRWRRPGGEVWSPARFIPEAERRGLMEPITAWTFEAACRAARALEDVGPPDFRIGVNLSAAVLGYGARDLVAAVLTQTGADPARLVVEITETAPFIEDAKAVSDVEAIADFGCAVAIDDFGAGRASLAYVVKLPAKRIKIDSGLARDVVRDPRARAAVAAAARLAADVGADVVGEGVETPELAEALATLGVDLGQGALYGAPVPQPSPLA